MERKMELSHPGEILKIEIIDGRSLTIGKASELLGRPTLSNILNGKASITPSMALRIEIVLVVQPDFGFVYNQLTNWI